MAEVLNTAEVDALFEKIEALVSGPVRRDLLLFVGKRLGAKGEELAGEYPPAPEQRAIQAGRNPYKRTGQLGRSITNAVIASEDAVTIEIGTNLKYAPYVIGDYQVDFHAQTGWRKLPQVLDDGMDQLRELTVDTLSSYLNGYLAGEG